MAPTRRRVPRHLALPVPSDGCQRSNGPTIETIRFASGDHRRRVEARSERQPPEIIASRIPDPGSFSWSRMSIATSVPDGEIVG